MTDSSPEAAAEAAVTTEPNTQIAEGSGVANSDASTSASSTEQAGMLDAVKAALKPTEASPASREPGEAADAETPDSTAEKEDPPPEDEQLSPEELKALSQKTQRRFQGLTSKVKAKDVEIASLKPKADEFEKIERFVTQAGMTNEEVGFLLTVGALSKGRPEEALKHLLPFVQQLQEQAGEVLPADLNERVRLGYITEQDARELNRARKQADNAGKRAEESETRQRQEQAQRERDDLVTRSLAATEKWESNKADKDPDWHLKRNQVAELCELAILKEQQKRGGPYFPTPEEVVNISEDALKEVNKRFKSRIPPANEVRPINPGGANLRTTPKPTSMEDVVRNAVA